LAVNNLVAISYQ